MTKLLNQVRPDIALFGEKDFQQLQVIRRAVRDLDLGVEIRGVPTIREADGLALSSRNRYLDRGGARRGAAPPRRPRPHRRRPAGGRRRRPAPRRGDAELAAAGFGPVQYLEVRDAETLAPLERVDGPARVIAAAYLGRTRLIDNVAV